MNKNERIERYVNIWTSKRNFFKMQLKSLNWIECGREGENEQVEKGMQCGKSFEKQKLRMVGVPYSSDDLCHVKQKGDAHVSKCAI